VRNRFAARFMGLTSIKYNSCVVCKCSCEQVGWGYTVLPSHQVFHETQAVSEDPYLGALMRPVFIARRTGFSAAMTGACGMTSVGRSQGEGCQSQEWVTVGASLRAKICCVV
jgi:hypothetical protein